MIEGVLNTDKLFDMNSIMGENQLRYSKISTQDKLIHYKNPDYCFIAPAETVLFLLLELQPLCHKQFGPKDEPHK